MLDLMLAVLVSAAAPTPAAGTTPVIGTEAVIPFFRPDRVRDFQVDLASDGGVYIQDYRRNWYYAKTIGPCPDLQFARALGVDTRRTNRLDRRSELIVQDRRCGIASFTHSAPPPSVEGD